MSDVTGMVEAFEKQMKENNWTPHKQYYIYLPPWLFDKGIEAGEINPETHEIGTIAGAVKAIKVTDGVPEGIHT